MAAFSVTAADPLIRKGSKWKFYDKEPALDEKWSALDFDDAAWSSGEARLGYGGDGEKTTLSFGNDDKKKIITYYFRQTFEVADASKIKKLKLHLLRDDGAVVYLNGKEIFRSNMPEGSVSRDTLALAAVGNEDEQKFFDASVPADLKTGRNVIAVEVHQAAPTSSDIGFDLELESDEN